MFYQTINYPVLLYCNFIFFGENVNYNKASKTSSQTNETGKSQLHAMVGENNTRNTPTSVFPLDPPCVTRQQNTYQGL